MKRLAPFAVLLLLAGCGVLPQPFRGHPGVMGARLAQPPPLRLAVPAPPNALLSDGAARRLARDMADDLANYTVPAVAAKPLPGDWRLAISAKTNGATVRPSYDVIDFTGKKQGSIDGAPVPAKDWAAGNPVMLAAAATAAAPQIAHLLTGIDAALKESDPHSLMNRPARVQLVGVTGAPGDGNTALASQMRRDLPGLGVVVIGSPKGADFLLHAQIRTGPAPKGAERIEIQWIVQTANGKELGRVAQLHDVPKGSLDHYWGDVAVVAAAQAARGVKQVIDNGIGKPPPAKPAAKAAS